MTKPVVGFIGLGWLGRPMAERVLSQGFQLIVFNRTRSKAEPLTERGARLADSPAEVADSADAIITVVGDNSALEAVCFGPEGVVTGMRPDTTHPLVLEAGAELGVSLP